MPENNHNAEQASADQTTTAQAEKVEGNELDDLRARLQTVEQQRDQYKDQAARAQADFENYQKRAARERATERRYAQAPLATDVVEALDNLERALDAARKAGDTGPLAQGVALAQAKFLDILRRHGVTRMEAEKRPFDPNQHEAVLQQPSKDHPPGTVVQVFEHGYLLHDRVLRPARVAVSKAPEPVEEQKPV
jgi:molecular chaperone GrpE